MSDAMSRNEIDVRLNFWLLQLAGWALFAIATFLGLGPHRTPEVPQIVYKVSLVAAEFLASFPLWLFCRWLWRRALGWPHLMGAAVLSCYSLGFVCSLLAFLAEREFGGGMIGGRAARSSLAIGFEGGAINSLVLIAWSGIYFGVKQWQEAQEREKRLLIAEALARKTQLRALNYQLTPHFLFNSLNAISTLVGEGHDQQARRMIARLGDFLRTALEEGAGSDVTLTQEIRHTQQYLAIEQMRLGERLKTKVRIDPEVRGVVLPKLLLQPLVENAVLHGIAPYSSPGEIKISAGRIGSMVHISIINRLQTDQTLPQQAVVRKTGIGLSNTEERLFLRYGNSYRLAIRNRHPQCCEVTIEVPFSATTDYERAANSRRNRRDH
jgi:hypothetical protein